MGTFSIENEIPNLNELDDFLYTIYKQLQIMS